MSVAYATITGRTFDLGKLTDAERALLRQALDRVRNAGGWNRFASWWLKAFNASGLEESSPVFRICRDLEARLGIAEGKVALPDYRDYLADLIEERFGTRYKFCKETGIDPAHLSRVFSGRSDLSMEMLRQALVALDAQMLIHPRERMRKSFSREEAINALAEGVR